MEERASDHRDWRVNVRNEMKYDETKATDWIVKWNERNWSWMKQGQEWMQWHQPPRDTEWTEQELWDWTSEQRSRNAGGTSVNGTEWRQGEAV